MKTGHAPTKLGVVLAEGLYLTFMLGDETFALPTSCVREVKVCEGVTRIAGAPEFVRGITRVRDEMATLVDLRIRLEYPMRDITATTLVIFVWIDKPIGIVVDAVTDVVRLTSAMMRPPPDLFAGLESAVVAGIGVVEGETLLLLNEASLRPICRECLEPLHQ